MSELYLSVRLYQWHSDHFRSLAEAALPLDDCNQLETNAHFVEIHRAFRLPARCNGVLFRPCGSRQLTFSAVMSFFSRSRLPRFASSRIALSPRSKSATSLSRSLTRSRGMAPSRFFLLGSAPYRISNLHISNLPLAALSCNGVTFHRSTTCEDAPLFSSNSVTSRCP